MNKIERLFIFLLGISSLFWAANACAISWEHDLDAALKKAKEAQKPLMLNFHTEWCGWCKKLDSDTFTDPKVDELSKNFVCVKIDGDKNRNAVAKYKVRGYPAIIFLNYGGKPEDRIAGYLPPDKFAGMIDAFLKKFPSPHGLGNDF